MGRSPENRVSDRVERDLAKKKLGKVPLKSIGAR